MVSQNGNSYDNIWITSTKSMDPLGVKDAFDLPGRVDDFLEQVGGQCNNIPPES